jgi:hypothetical protein
MSDRAKSVETQIDYKGRKLLLHVKQEEEVGNDWVQYSIRCEDGTFNDVFCQNPVSLRVKSKLPYQPENDLEARTPEQTILVRSTWNEIQRLFH